MEKYIELFKNKWLTLHGMLKTDLATQQAQ